MKDDFQILLDNQLKNPEFRKEWEALESEFEEKQARYNDKGCLNESEQFNNQET